MSVVPEAVENTKNESFNISNSQLSDDSAIGGSSDASNESNLTVSSQSEREVNCFTDIHSTSDSDDNLSYCDKLRNKLDRLLKERPPYFITKTVSDDELSS